MPMRKTGSWRPLGVALAALVLLVLAASVPGGRALSAAPAQLTDVQASYRSMFNIDVQLPEGSRIDYVRLYYYDNDPTLDSSVWLTSHIEAGGTSDLVFVSSEGSPGYGSAVSAYIGQIVDTVEDAYVLNWEPGGPGPRLTLCSLRIAYRLDGGASDFYYLHVAGTALRPRDWRVESGYGGGGCLYQKPDYAIYMYMPSSSGVPELPARTSP